MSIVARAVLATLLMTLLCAVQLASPPMAAADVTTLCNGYSGCAKQGMSDGGYGKANGSMYWRMYSGHNCTNYAAYRMVQSGMANVRPWEGAGNATYWGTSMSKITDGTPMVGAVAWWRAGVWPAGSAGHVAYVERVVSADTIIISQDSWGGDFSWAKVTRGSRGWPSGFIHFNDATLTNTSRPTITGRAQVGATLSVSPGSWSPSADVTFQWRAGGADLRGATGPTFTVGEAQQGKRLRVRVSGTKLGYPTTTVLSQRTRRVLPGKLENTTAPSVSGEPVVDGVLTASAGSWDPTPGAVSFRWLADGRPVEGAAGEQLTLTPELLGKALSVRVTASRSGFADVVVTSAPTGPVVKAQFTDVSEPALSGVPRLGEILQLAPGSSLPAGTPTVQWLRNGQVVDGAGGTSYTLTTEDLGARMSALVRWDRPGYVPADAPTLRTKLVKAAPTLDVRLRQRGHGIRVRAQVVAPDGVSTPERVWVRSGRTRLAVPLVDGLAVTRLSGLPSGTRNLRVLVPASRTVAAARWTGGVTIP